MILDLTFYQVGFGYLFVVILLVILRARGIKRERILLWATIRMTLQLMLMGYVLIWLFNHPHPLLTLAVVLLMMVFAIYTIFRKYKHDLRQKMKTVIMLTFPLGTIPVLLYFSWIVIRIDPYYDARYIIPITGMIIGNSMTGITLGLHTILQAFKHERDAIEAHLLLGANIGQATKDIANRAFDNAIMPTLNSMLGMGIIFLPGMMTGQILSGVVPTTAIMYQIAIMMGILGSVTITTYLVIRFGTRTYFNHDLQIES
ncbi:MAG: iron export ABC transporter permease subunit FetB [Acholeplasmataceae bacterium]|nr:MAG: iron export ABC transporter permease subunit FetB [Acholeplasmataceae bacterium]